ncbi:DUF1516 family protein [Fructilactobacillus fructivorans]|uniref:Uncharacterized protein n=1 Tax=Fructilactobacillus fructivorans TaxID=1614 RepID=A0A0C1Q197_9LACO|nr:hypothetical protein LfDm3_0850 [Fructilactobacillus fructivorans]
MMLIWIHLLTWLVLFIAVCIALFSNWHFKAMTMIARLCYVILIISGIFLVPYAWGRDPILTVVKIICALLLIGLIEMAFAFKSQQKLSKTFLWITIVAIIIVAIIGIMLAGGRPFIHFM